MDCISAHSCSLSQITTRQVDGPVQTTKCYMDRWTGRIGAICQGSDEKNHITVAHYSFSIRLVSKLILFPTWTHPFDQDFCKDSHELIVDFAEAVKYKNREMRTQLQQQKQHTSCLS